MKLLTYSLYLAALLSFAPAGDDWFSFLGLTFSDTEAATVLAKFGEYDKFRFRDDYETQLNYFTHGFALTMNDAGEFQKFYFFNDGYELNNKTFRQYGGELPLGLSFGLKPAQVKALLGMPTLEEGSAYKRLYYETTFSYEVVFNNNEMQYLRIGLLPKKE
jgi:hypothetical protein